MIQFYFSYINVFGKPNGLNSTNVHEFLKDANLNQSGETSRETNSNNSKTNTTSDISKFEHLAPPEFFDSITNELMSMPYLLPSGKNIDKTSLDKYLDSRNPDDVVDPFTRKPFTDCYKPIFNSDLKIQIDLFITTQGRSQIEKRSELKRKLFECN